MTTPDTWSNEAEAARLSKIAWPLHNTGRQFPKNRGAEIPENMPPREESECPCCHTLLCEHGFPGDRYCPRCSL